MTLSLHPAMPRFAAPDWAGAQWVGGIDRRDTRHDEIRLQDAEGYTRARLLVRNGRTVLGFVTVDASNGGVNGGELRRAIEKLPARDPSPVSARPPTARSVTVVVCTRDRPDHLRTALQSILELDYPNFTVLIVDNAPRTAKTHDLVRDEFADPRVSYRLAPIAGTSRARNVALVYAPGDIVAYVDDDVVVDRYWLTEIMAAFDLAADVGCVTGLVPSGELRTRVQQSFDERVSWAKNLDQTLYRLSAPPPNLPLFPFCIGDYGTGANFALHRETALGILGFDSALGGGVPTYGGEDIDIFVRTLLSGAALVVQPSAITWHRHRDDLAALTKQARGYGTGLGAWAAKLLSSRRTACLVIARAPRALKRLVGIARTKPGPDAATSITADTRTTKTAATPDPGQPDELSRVLARMGWIELASVFTGPLRLAALRRAGYGHLNIDELAVARSLTRTVT
ncbi:MAG: glycosyltransferase [Microbacteriaceae bacterium]|nr:glycosyltransferase [Microbacteriaceae bacterium]